MNVQSAEGDSVVLEILSDTQPEDQGTGTTGQTDSPLILAIKFRLDGGIRPVFAGATVRKFRMGCVAKTMPRADLPLQLLF